MTALAAWMQTAGETDDTLAEKIGVTRVHVSRLRRRVHRPRPELAAKIAQVTGIPAWELVKPDGAS